MFGTLLTITWAPNTTGLPPDANPAYNPLVELLAIKVSEMQTANLLGNINANNGITTLEFLNITAAQDYQNFVTEVVIDLNQSIPEFSITDLS